METADKFESRPIAELREEALMDFFHDFVAQLVEQHPELQDGSELPDWAADKAMAMATERVNRLYPPLPRASQS